MSTLKVDNITTYTGSGTLQVTATTTDVDGILIVDGSNISLDSTSTLNIDCSNTSNGITIGTATSGVPVSIGHSTSEVTVNDNLTVTGNLTVNGSTTTIDTTNTIHEDALIGLAYTAGNNDAAAGDRGLIMGLDGENDVAMIWDESHSEFAFITTTSAPDATTVTVTSYASVATGPLSLQHTDTTLWPATVGASDEEYSDFLLTLRNNTDTEHAFAGIAFDVSSEDDADSIGAAILATGDNTTSTAHDANLVFATNDAGDDGLTERMRVTHDGNVGIGTVTPSEKLEVSLTGANGGIRVVNDTDNAYLKLSAPADEAAYVDFSTGTSNDWQIGRRPDSNDLTIYDNDGGHSGDAGYVFVWQQGGNVGIGVLDPDSQLEVLSTSTQQKWSYDADSFATLTVADASHTTLATGESGNITLDSDNQIILDANGDMWKFSTNGSLMAYIQNSSGDIILHNETQDKDIKFSGNDGGSGVTALTLDMSEAGAATFNSSIAATSITASSNLDVDGTANLDDVDIDGNVQLDGTFTVGVNDTGYDVKFFGATAGAFMEWDESADELEIRGGAASPGKLLLSTAETTVVNGDKLGQIDFQAPLEADGNDAILVAASIWAEADDTFANNLNDTDLVFATGKSEAAAEKMRLDSDGRLGIGVSDPDAQVEIFGSGGSQLKLSNNADDYAAFTVGTNGDLIITTVDANAAQASLTCTIDGAIKLDGDGVEIENDSDSGATALLIDNDDTNQIALDIEAANIDADVVRITAAALTTGNALFIDHGDSATDAQTVVGMHYDFDKAGVAANSVTQNFTGFDLDLNDGATNHAGSTVNMTGLDIDVVSANAQGTLTNKGLSINVTGADTNIALEVVAGAISMADSQQLVFGTGFDCALYWDTDVLNIDNDIEIQDDKKIYFGNGKDASIAYDENSSDQLIITQPAAGIVIAGTNPKLVIGDGGAEDTALVFDGNAQDFYMGIDDTDDKLHIGLGSAVGTTANMVLNSADRDVTFKGDISVEGGDISLPLGASTVAQAAQSPGSNANGITITASSVTGGSGAPNMSGGNITFVGGLGTGTGNPGKIIFKTANKTGSGNSAQAAQVEVMAIDKESGLVVTNNTSSSASEGASLRLVCDDGAAMGSGDRLGVIEFAGAENSSSALVVGAKIEALCDAGWGSSENGADLVFYTTDGDAAQAENMRIYSDSTSGVQIKNTTASSASEGGKLRLTCDDGSAMEQNHRLGVIEFAGRDNTGAGDIVIGARIEAVTQDAAWDDSNNDAKLSFYTTNGTTETEVLKLSHDGLATFSGGLDIAGAVDIAGDLTLSAGADGALKFTNAGKNSIEIPNSQANALVIEQADTAYMSFDTTDSLVVVAKTLVIEDDVAIALGSDAESTLKYEETSSDEVAWALPTQGLRYGTGKHILATTVDIRKADSGDNTTAHANKILKIPAKSIITSVTAIPSTDSNLGTHLVNLWIHTNDSLAHDADVSGGTEILGAGVANTDSTQGTSASDINMNDTNEVWICRDTVRVPAGNDYYLYVANAGTGNGTTDPTGGTLSIFIEYYGID